jgi:cytochrome c oxidase cbb3-type subunit III
VIRRWLVIVLIAVIPAAYVVAFLAMGWIRSHQGHGEQVFQSQIAALAISQEPADPLADARARGDKVYRHYCQICHGTSGKGDGFNSSRLDPRPRDFTDVTFWQETREDRVHDAVAQGGTVNGKSVLMPAWGHTLTEQQLHDVIIFIRSFAAPAKP